MAEEEWRRSEQCRECVSTDRDEELSDVQDSDEEERAALTRGAGGASDTIQTTTTSGGSIRRSWEMTGLHGSTIYSWGNSQSPLFILMSI